MKHLKENSVEARIRFAAEFGDSAIHSKRYEVHKTACRDIADFAQLNPTIPFWAILASGVSSGAFKLDSYLRGYKGFDWDKAESIKDMANAYNTHMGLKGKPSDVVWRLAIKFYNEKSHSVDDFKAALQNGKLMDGDRGHFKELCENLGL